MLLATRIEGLDTGAFPGPGRGYDAIGGRSARIRLGVFRRHADLLGTVSE